MEVIKMRKHRYLAFFMVLLMLFTYSGVAAFAGVPANHMIKSKGVEDNLAARPDALEQGQVWTEKRMASVEDSLDFVVTLFAWGAKFLDEEANAWIDPLEKGTGVTVIDTLGDFVLVEDSPLPFGVTYDQVSGTVTWVVGQEDILGEGAQISYTVRLKDSWKVDTTYWTGEAKATFKPVEGNPYYWELTDSRHVAFEPAFSWNNGNGFNNGTINDNLLGVSLAFTNNSGSCNTELGSKWNSKDIYSNIKQLPAKATWGKVTDTRTGTVYDYHLIWQKSGDRYLIIIKNLEEGMDVVYEIMVDNNGGNKAIPGCRVFLENGEVHHIVNSSTEIITYVWVKKPNVGWLDGKEKAVAVPLPVKGYIELTKSVSSLKITKKDMSGKIEKDKEFEITVVFSGEGAGDLGAFKGAVKNDDNSYTIQLKVGEVFTFDDLPMGIEYEVTEGELPYDYRAPAISDPTNGVLSAGGANVTVNNYKKTAGIAVEKNIVELDKVGNVVAVKDGRTYTGDDLIVYGVVITNTGEMPLRHVKWTEEPGFEGPFRTYSDAVDPNGETFSPRNSGYTLGIGGSMTVYYTYTVLGVSVDNDGVSNTVSVSGKDPGGNEVKDSDSKDVEFRHPNLSVKKEIVGGNNTFGSGETAVFMITVTNDGSADATGVKLSDQWFDGISTGTLTVTGPEDVNPSDFSVGQGQSVVFTCSAELQGMTLKMIQDKFEQMIEDLEQTIEDNQFFIDVTAPEEQDNAWSALSSAFGEYGAFIEDESEIWKVFGSLEYYEDEDGFGEGYYPEELEPLEEAIGVYYDAMAEFGIKKINQAEEAVKAAKAEIESLNENGLTYSETLMYAGNTAVVEYAYGKVTDDVEIIVKPESESDISLEKYISIDGESWQKSLVLDNEGGTVYYKLVIKNNGTGIEEITVTDSLATEKEETVSIGPGGVREVTYTYKIGQNSDYYRPALVPNTAKLTFKDADGNDSELKSSALVTVLPKPFSELLIDKKVSFDARKWSNSLSIFSDDQVSVTYRVMVANIGTQTATFSLDDAMISGGVFTNPACTTAYGGDIKEITLRPLGMLILYYKADLSETTKNVVSYKITSENEKPGKGTGSDEANVVIDPVPTVVISLAKEVVTESEYNSANTEAKLDGLNWRDSAQVMNKYGEGGFWFRITLSNSGNYPAEVKLSDVMKSGAKAYDFGDALTDSGITGEDEFIPLSPGAKQTFYLYANISTSGSDEIAYENIVTVEEVFHEMPPGYEATYDESDSAKISVVKTDKPVIDLVIDKKVKDKNGSWVDFASYTGDSANVEFRVIVKAIPNGESNLDELGDFTISGSVVDELNGSPAPVPEGFDWSFTLTQDSPSKTFIYTAEGLTGENKNVALIDKESLEYDSDEFVVNVNERGEADVKITKEEPPTQGGPTGGGSDPSGGDPGSSESGSSEVPENTVALIGDSDIPLARLPDEPMVIPNEDVPLGDIPQTGLGTDAFSIMMLGMSIMALMALAVGRIKVKGEK